MINNHNLGLNCKDIKRYENLKTKSNDQQLFYLITDLKKEAELRGMVV